MAILRAVWEKYGVKIDRKAVKRHLEMLEALGFPIEYHSRGYRLR
jgi:biotin operon repressor